MIDVIARICAGALLLAALPLDVSAGELNPREQAIVEWISDHSEKALAELEKALLINSPTEDFAGQRAMADYYAGHFGALGFDTQWIDLAEATGRAGHFQAELAGTRGQRVLLLGHLDTVLPAMEVRREDGRLYGSGSVDMKGGNMVVLFALQALHAAGALEDRRVIVHYTGDEESTGRPIDVTRAPMREAAKRSDVALSFEGGRANRAVVARRSASRWTLTVESVTGHSSGVFGEQRGYGAIYEAARILNSFRENMAGEENLTFNAALISGGATAELERTEARAWGKDNIIPAVARVHGDLRVISMEQLESAKASMKQIVETFNLPHTSASIEISDSYPPMSPTPENYALLDELSGISEALGYGTVEAFDPGSRGAGDISFVAPYIPGLDGLGVRGGNSHAEGEYMDMDSLVRQTQRAALMIYRLTRD
jgi:glutamate carboxypeptidase